MYKFCEVLCNCTSEAEIGSIFNIFNIKGSNPEPSCGVLLSLQRLLITWSKHEIKMSNLLKFSYCFYVIITYSFTKYMYIFFICLVLLMSFFEVGELLFFIFHNMEKAQFA